MAIPQGAKPKSSSQFAKLQDGPNKFRFLSDVIFGWEGWKAGHPFRHPGEICKIKPEQVDIDEKSGRPKINFFWAMTVWNYREKKVQVLELTQKTIQRPLYDLELNEDWGDLKNYDVTITRSKEGDKVSYTTTPSPAKPLTDEILEAKKNTKVELEKLFEGEYPMDAEVIPPEDSPF